MSLLFLYLLTLSTLNAQETAKEWVERGMDHFVAGEIAKSVEAFDKAVAYPTTTSESSKRAASSLKSTAR
jgi:hypothetical protein